VSARQLIALIIITEIRRFKGLLVKEAGFSTFLRGCNPARPDNYQDQDN
jgi:hypothetical protein